MWKGDNEKVHRRDGPLEPPTLGNRDGPPVRCNGWFDQPPPDRPEMAAMASSLPSHTGCANGAEKLQVVFRNTFIAHFTVASRRGMTTCAEQTCRRR